MSIRTIAILAAACAALSSPALAGDTNVEYRVKLKDLKRGLTGSSMLEFSFYHDADCSTPFEVFELAAGSPALHYDKIKPMRVKRTQAREKQVEIRLRADLSAAPTGSEIRVKVRGHGIVAVGDECQLVLPGLAPGDGLPGDPIGLPGDPTGVLPPLGECTPTIPGLGDLPIDGLPGLPDPTTVPGLVIGVAQLLLPGGLCDGAFLLAQSGAWLARDGGCDPFGNVVFDLIDHPFATPPVCFARVEGDFDHELGGSLGLVTGGAPGVSVFSDPYLASITLGAAGDASGDLTVGVTCVGLP